MAEHLDETRLDRLWRAVAVSGMEADWLRFYEGFAAQSLVIPVEDAAATTTKPITLALETGEVALGFDTEARFAAFITTPTEFVTLTGADLACALTPLGVGVALNPGVAAGETVLDPPALAWIAQHTAAEVATDEMPGGTRVQPPVSPESLLLEALATRLAEMTGHIAEAWLLGTAAPDGSDAYLCVVRPAGEATSLGPEIAAEITRISQIRALQPFSVAVVEEETRLLGAARRFGIGLVELGGHDCPPLTVTGLRRSTKSSRTSPPPRPAR